MTITDEFVHWLQNIDVRKAVTAIAAPGGIWFWIDKYRNRIRITIRNLNLPTGDTSLRRIKFEAENVSGTLTSLEPTFLLTGYTPERKKQVYSFTIEGTDRQLPAHVPKQVVAIHNEMENRIMLFLWFTTFQVALTRGGRVRARFRNAEFKQIGFLRFQWERMLFVTLGKVPD